MKSVTPKKFMFAAAFAFAMCAPSLAADKTWQGGGTQDANNRYLVSSGDNWSGGVAPAENDTLTFDATGAGSVSFDAGLNYGAIYFNGGTYDGYNCVTGGEIRVCRDASTTATLRKQDGDWAVTYDVRAGEGNGSLGTFQHSGGTLNIGRTLFVGSANYASATDNRVTIDGGTVYVNGTSSGNYRAVALGFMAKSTGMAYLTVSGTGRLVVTQANNIWIGRGGAGYMTIADDAVVDVSNGLVAFFGGELARDNIGNAKNENCVSFLYLNGGTLLTQCIKYGASDPNNHRLRVGMYFNGGTLKATADSDSFIMIPYGDTTPDGNVRVQANGGTIDTNGHTINVRQKLDPPSSGTSGDLVITGGGTYTQTGVTAYNGRTIVDGNTKYIKNNASSNLKLVVKAGSSFQNAATLASRVAGESLTFEDGAKLVVEPTANQIAVSAPAIDVQGALTVSSSPAALGVYTLMQITGSGTFAADVLSRITFENADFTVSLSADGKTISMVPSTTVPVYAKMVKGEGDVYAWRFYNYYWNDITDACGLSVPAPTIKVYVTSTEEVAPILANPGTPAGYRIGNLSADADLTSLSPLVIETGSEIDLNGHALTVSGTVVDALKASTRDLVVNGNFEAKSLSNGAYDTSAISGWSKSGTVALIKNNNSYAYKQSSSGSGDKQNTTVMCYIAKNGYITQTINVPEQVLCTLSLNKTNKNYYNSGNKYNDSNGSVQIDGSSKTTLASNAGNQGSISTKFELAAGSHTLKIACTSGTGFSVDNVKLTCTPSTATITSSAAGGELHVNVPENTAVTNSAVNITGHVKFVKEGAGTFVSKRTELYYDGGNEIVEGKLITAEGSGSNRDWSAAYRTLGATGKTMTVRKNGTLDIAGNYEYGNYSIVLDGGTLRSGKVIDTSPINQTTNTSWNGIGKLSLTTNSTFYLRSDTLFSGWDDTPINLNGHELLFQMHIDSKNVWMAKDMTNGTIRLTPDNGGKRKFAIFKRNVDARTVDVIDEAGCISPLTTFSVRSYISKASTGTDFWNGTARMYVYGTFTPVTDYFYGCTMMDGSTIDLSGRSGTLSLTSAANCGRRTVDFADNATIYVKLGDRRGFSSRTPVISWTTRPSNLDGLTFKRAEGNVKMIKKDDGVYIQPGLIMIVK